MTKSIKYLLLFLGMTLSGSSFAQFVVLNKGIGGNNSEDLIARMDKDVLAEEPDLVIVMVGTNDMINSRKLLSYADYRINYQRIISKLKARGITVVVMSPPSVDEAYVLKRHDPNKYKEALNVKIDSMGSIVKELAQEHSLYFIDLHQAFKSVGSPSRESSSLMINQANYGLEDGTHPTKAGYKFMTEIIYRYLKDHKLLEKDKKVICFGDSITYGSYMLGAGTAEGDTYPAYLSFLINQ